MQSSTPKQNPISEPWAAPYEGNYEQQTFILMSLVAILRSTYLCPLIGTFSSTKKPYAGSGYTRAPRHGLGSFTTLLALGFAI